MSFDVDVANKMTVELHDELNLLKTLIEAKLGELDEEGDADDDVKESPVYVDLADKIESIDTHLDNLDYLMEDLRKIGRAGR